MASIWKPSKPLRGVKPCAWPLARLNTRAIEQRINADSSDYAGPHLPCRCGEPVRYAGCRAKSFQSVLGEIRPERAYYHCRSCRSGFCPRDLVLRIEKTCLSPAVSRMVGRVGAMVSFEEGRQLLEELAGLRIDASQVERGAESLGVEIAADERRYTEPLEEKSLPPKLYIPMRAVELAERAARQPDGSAKTRVVKLCVIWSAEGRNSKECLCATLARLLIEAAIEIAASPDGVERSAFAERVLHEAARRRFCDAPRRAIIGDGAPWIWNWIWNMDMECRARIVPRRDPDRRPIPRQRNSTPNGTVDLWNRQGAEPDMGYSALHGTGQRQIARHCDDLRPYVASCPAAAKCLIYLCRNRSRMRYLKLRAQGLCTSSGVVEAGCKVAIGARLKRAGMHWTRKGAKRHHRPPLLPSQW